MHLTNKTICWKSCPREDIYRFLELFLFIFSSRKYLEDWTEHFTFPLKATTTITIDNVCFDSRIWWGPKQSATTCSTLIACFSPTTVVFSREFPRAKLWRSEVLVRINNTNLNIYSGTKATTIVINTKQMSYWKETRLAASKQLRSLTLNITYTVWTSTHVLCPLLL